MKRQIALTIAALFLSVVISKSQGFVSLSFGSALPVGDFASTNVNKDGCGFAKVGPTIELTLGRIFWKHFGLTTNLRYQKNGNDYWTIRYSTPNATIKSDPYASFTGFIGPYYEFSIGKNYQLDIKLQGGFIISPYPETTVNEG